MSFNCPHMHFFILLYTVFVNFNSAHYKEMLSRVLQFVKHFFGLVQQE